MADAIDTLWSAAQAAHAAGDLARAEQLCREILGIDPRNAEAMHLLGIIAHQAGRPDVAAELIRRAIALRSDISSFHTNFGIVLEALGRIHEATDSYRCAIELNPESFAALSNLSGAFRALGRLEEAVACGRRAIEIRPDFANGMQNLSIALTEQGQVDEAISLLRRALLLKPDFPQARDALLLNLHYPDGISPLLIAEEHRVKPEERDRQLAKRKPKKRTKFKKGRYLRVGYVSPDFRRHPVAFFLEPILKHHNRKKIRAYAYSAVALRDEITTHFSQIAEYWRDISKLDASAVAKMIRADKIDILIDLAGHMGDNRLDVFALKPAPVQMTYLGYPDTTGLTEIDYRITDAHADPSGITDRYHSENLLRLPKTFLCYQPASAPPVVPRDPSAAGVTFGSFNHWPKVSRATLATWAAILKAVPGSRLLLKSAALGEATTQRRVHDAFAELGIESHRVELLGNVSSHSHHLEIYHRVDIALDTFPYNGTTTTCEALWMGVPVVTLAGQVHAGRVGVSLLSNVGLPELIAESRQNYVEIATKLARDFEKLTELRSSLRERMAKSPLMDPVGFTHDLEDAYRAAWQDKTTTPK